MTPVEIAAGIISLLTPVLLLILRWIDKRDARLFRQAEAKQAAIWKQADVDHKRRMELAAMSAAHCASESVKQVKASKEERAAQIDELKEMITENTEVSKTAFKESNGVNAKLVSIGIQVARNGAAARVSDHLEAKNVTIEAQRVEVHTDQPNPNR